MFNSYFDSDGRYHIKTVPKNKIPKGECGVCGNAPQESDNVTAGDAKNIKDGLFICTECCIKIARCI